MVTLLGLMNYPVYDVCVGVGDPGLQQTGWVAQWGAPRMSCGCPGFDYWSSLLFSLPTVWNAVGPSMRRGSHKWTHQVVYKVTDLFAFNGTTDGIMLPPSLVAIGLFIGHLDDFVLPLFTSHTFPEPPNHVDEILNPIALHSSVAISPVPSRLLLIRLLLLYSVTFRGD